MKSPPKQKLTPLVAKIEAELTQRIVSGVYPPHSYIPSERDLARQLDVSRLTISSALAVLEKNSLVSRDPGRGTRVLPVFERLAQPLIGVVFVNPQAYRPDMKGQFTTLEGMLATLRRLHCRYEVTSLSSHSEPSGSEALARFGAIITTGGIWWFEEAIAEEARKRFLPVAVAKLEIEPRMEVSATWVDHRASTLEAVRLLARMGHRRIGLITREPEYGFYAKAQEGYRAGLQEAGLPVNDSFIAYAPQTDALSGYFAAKTLLNGASPMPTAIIAGRDSLAEGVCRALEEARIRIGHDVSVVGFDDMNWPREDPYLTTFREPCFEMGAVAAEMLIARIVDPSLAAERRQFETPLVLRRSAGPPMPDAAAHTEGSSVVDISKSTDSVAAAPPAGTEDDR